MCIRDSLYIAVPLGTFLKLRNGSGSQPFRLGSRSSALLQRRFILKTDSVDLVSNGFRWCGCTMVVERYRYCRYRGAWSGVRAANGPLSDLPDSTGDISR